MPAFCALPPELHLTFNQGEYLANKDAAYSKRVCVRGLAKQASEGCCLAAFLTPVLGASDMQSP